MTPLPAPGQPPMIWVDDVSKWMGEVVAVNAMSFSVEAGVTALLGPNGAGKSTLLRMLGGLTAPSRGSVRVLGADPRTDLAVTRRIGMAPQQEGIFEFQSALAFVRLAATLHGLHQPDDAARAAIRAVDLDPDDVRPLGTYSKGMRQRVKLAQAIVHEPEVLLLDEPLNGLDPRQRAQMIQIVQALGEAGRCVIVSSHVLEEVERFGSRVIVMAQGRLAAEGDFRAIRNLMDDRPHRIRVRSDNPRALATGLLGSGVISGVTLLDSEVMEVETTEAPAFRQALMTAARSADAVVVEVAPLDDDLESVFRYVVGAASR